MDIRYLASVNGVPIFLPDDTEQENLRDSLNETLKKHRVGFGKRAGLQDDDEVTLYAIPVEVIPEKVWRDY